MRSLAEPLAVEDRTIRARHCDYDVCVRDAFFAAFDRGDVDAHPFAHPRRESLSALCGAAEHLGARDGADGTYCFKLGASLVAGADDADRGGVLTRHVLRGDAACCAGADLPEVAGFEEGKQLAGVGAEELDVEPDRVAVRNAVSLESHYSGTGSRRAHEVEEAAVGQADARARGVRGTALGHEAECFFNGLEGEFHREDFVNFGFGEVEGQRYFS